MISQETFDQVIKFRDDRNYIQSYRRNYSMLLLDYIKEKVTCNHIIFEYGYYGVGGSFMKDENLSTEGNKEQLISFVEKQGTLRFLYACSGECNDFEVMEKDGILCLRYIDFR